MADFTFVVPVYKVPYKFLSQCVNSILSQSHEDIELILVDDGSPDDCGRYCDEFASQDGRIKVVHKQNGGLSDARNAGTDVASSPWVTYVDGDDWVETDFAETFLKRLEQTNHNADIYIYAGYRDYATRVIVPTPYFPDGTLFSNAEDRELLQKECCKVFTKNTQRGLFIGSACGKVYRRTFLTENSLRFTIVPYGEDSIFYFHSIEKAELVEYVYKAVYHYRDTEGSMVNKYREKADEEQRVYLNELFKFAKEYHKSASFVDNLYYRVMVSMQRMISQKYFNPQNPDRLKERQKACSVCFSNEPYSEFWKHVSFRELNNNGKIKYLLLRFRLYFLMEVFRSVFLRVNKTERVNRNS